MIYDYIFDGMNFIFFMTLAKKNVFLSQKGKFTLQSGKGKSFLGRLGITYEFPLVVKSMTENPIFLIEIRDYNRPLGVDILQKIQRIQHDLTEKYKLLLFTNTLSKASQRFLEYCKFLIMTRPEIIRSIQGENLDLSYISNKKITYHQSKLNQYLPE